MGAWIETCDPSLYTLENMSHPMWVRGLKQSNARYYLPHLSSHPMWVRGLKHGKSQPLKQNTKSHPMWVRGLKHCVILDRR